MGTKIFKHSYMLSKFVKDIAQTLDFNYEQKDLEYPKVIEMICNKQVFKR